jgi:hypothetical protein
LVWRFAKLCGNRDGCRELLEGRAACGCARLWEPTVTRSKYLSAVALAACVLALTSLAPQPAAAQGLLGAIFGALGLEPQRSPRPTYAPRDGYPDAPPGTEPVARSGGGTNCVRLCDGRYFPMPRSSSGRALDTNKVCAALCPAAQTKVFSGSSMEYATATDGTRYSDLDNAFAFRDRNMPECSCTGHGPGGLAQIDVESDPTLRAGDLVILATGPAMFRGSNQFPYRTADFTPVGDMTRVANDVRQKLSEVQVDPDAVPVVPAQRLAPEDAPRAAAPPPRPRPPPQQQRSNFPLFPFFQ